MKKKTFLEKKSLESFIDQKWDDSIIPELCEFIKIPNLSPAFDAEWKKNGYMDQAVKRVADWCINQKVKGLDLKIEELEGRTPLLYIEIAGKGDCADETILFYGHLDKQPEMEGWDADKGPWKPVLQNEKLYGRGGADDGYAVFTSIAVIKALQEQNIPHARCIIIIESCEESGSYDLPFYIDFLQHKIGTPDLIVCLDSGCGNYDQLWLTTSLRGISMGDLRVELLKKGVHSGNGSGVIASSFRVLRKLLDRIEDVDTGRIKIREVNADIPAIRLEHAKKAADIIGSEFADSFPLLDGVETVSSDPIDLILNRTWRPSLSTIAVDGFPKSGRGGNVLRPMTSMVLSLRLPPTIDSTIASERLKQVLEEDPPYNAKVSYTILDGAVGWNAPELADWLKNAAEEASQLYFQQEPVYMGEGGSIPFMNLLSKKYPKAQFLITGLLGPHSNAHGPNEFLHIQAAKRLTCCIANVIAAHSQK